MIRFLAESDMLLVSVCDPYIRKTAEYYSVVLIFSRVGILRLCGFAVLAWLLLLKSEVLVKAN